MNMILRKIVTAPIIIFIMIPVLLAVKSLWLISYPFVKINKWTDDFKYPNYKIMTWIYYSWISKEKEAEKMNQAALASHKSRMSQVQYVDKNGKDIPKT